MRESIIKIANDISDLNIEFWICGICNSDDYKIELKNKVRTDNVIFDFRFINNGEIPSLLSKVDIVLIPYNVESSLNSGVAILAFSYAKTVISTEIGTVLDFLDSGMVYVYNNSQNDELKNTLCSIYDEIQKDSHFLEVKGSGMLEYVRKHNNVDFIKKELAKVYL